MSLDATKWAWEQKCRPSHKLVLLSLADRAGESHECYPSIRRLVADTGLDRETIMDAISIMESMGILQVIRTNGKQNAYKLLGVSSRHEKHESAPEPVGETRPVGKTLPVGKLRQDQSGKPDRYQSGKPDTNLSIEPTNKQTGENLPRDPHPVGLNISAWECWLEYRKQIKKPIRPVSFVAAQKDMAKFGSLQAEVVEQSIANGWQGLFPLKNGFVADKSSVPSPWEGAV